MKTYIVAHTKDEGEILSNLASKGKHKSQKIQKTLIVPDCNAGELQTSRSISKKIARNLHTSMKGGDRVKKLFVEEGFDFALNRRERERVYAKKHFKDARIEFSRPLRHVIDRALRHQEPAAC